MMHSFKIQEIKSNHLLKSLQSKENAEINIPQYQDLLQKLQLEGEILFTKFPDNIAVITYDNLQEFGIQNLNNPTEYLDQGLYELRKQLEINSQEEQSQIQSNKEYNNSISFKYNPANEIVIIQDQVEQQPHGQVKRKNKYDTYFYY